MHAHNNRGSSVFCVVRAMPSARQRSFKHASLIEEGVFYVVRAVLVNMSRRNITIKVITELISYINFMF
jgi:hypothetical protein